METFLYDSIHRYIFPYIDSNMYILAENREALVVDPHISAEADRFLKTENVEKVTVLLTHEHFDHICGIPWFRKHYDTKVICQREALNPRRQKHFGRPLVVALILSDRGENEKIRELENEYSVCKFTADQVYDEISEIAWQGHSIRLEHIPGHSPASSLITMDGDCVFTGDSLIPDAEPTIRWPWSDAEIYQEKAIPRLLKIPDACMIFPGHRDRVAMKHLKYENGVFTVK